jgi:hypothetical protein
MEGCLFIFQLVLLVHLLNSFGLLVFHPLFISLHEIHQLWRIEEVFVLVFENLGLEGALSILLHFNLVFAFDFINLFIVFPVLESFNYWSFCNLMSSKTVLK